MNFLYLTLVVCAFANAMAFQLPHTTTTSIKNDKITTVWKDKKTSLLFPLGGIPFAKLSSSQVHPRFQMTSSSVDVTTNNQKEEEWTKSRLHNKNWFRSLVILSAVWIAGKTVAPNSPAVIGRVSRAGAVLHLFSFGTWFGTVFYTTFIAGLTMFQNLPRQTFGKLQSKLFPKYFFLSSVTIIVQLLTLPIMIAGRTQVTKTPLVIALLTTLLNQIILEPYSTKIMLERYDLENSTGGTNTDRYKVLKAEFGKMHGMSSLTNLIAFCGAIVHGYFLSSLLV